MMASPSHSHRQLRIRDLGYLPGQLPTGPKNSILDVPGINAFKHSSYLTHYTDDIGVPLAK